WQFYTKVKNHSQYYLWTNGTRYVTDRLAQWM
ncbi:MAG: hypothetical protein ACI9UN_003953, partial [Granulosicoccus sp.]